MQEGAGAAAPLYVVHPIDGGVLCYGDLARALGDDKPLYALRAPSPESPLANGTTIETMAADYLRVVERHAGDRPYQVGGWSFGGLVALEMARRASAAGRSPDLVVLIDPTDAAHEVDPNWTDGDLAQMFLTGLVRLIGAADRPPLTGVPATIDFDAQLDHAVRLGCLAVDIDRDACRAAFLTYLRTNRATASYRPEPYAGAALLIQPRPDPERPRDDPWPALLPQAQRVVFDGNHFSLMRDANGDQLAALVRAHDSASKGAQ
jgi:thioesterase domain-containing protein